MKKNVNPKGKNAIKSSEKELVGKAQSGDFAAFNELIDGYRAKIFGLAVKMTRTREDAEDVFQETFLKAIDNIGKFRAESSFGTWLYAIAVNIVRAKYGRERSTDLLQVEEYLPEKHEHGDKPPEGLSDWNDPLSRMTNREIQSRIDDAIAELPPKYRLPFLLRYMEEMSLQEVADTLHLTLANTKSRILRARLALRKSLDSYFAEGHKDVTL